MALEEQIAQLGDSIDVMTARLRTYRDASARLALTFERIQHVPFDDNARRAIDLLREAHTTFASSIAAAESPDFKRPWSALFEEALHLNTTLEIISGGLNNCVGWKTIKWLVGGPSGNDFCAIVVETPMAMQEAMTFVLKAIKEQQ